MAKKNFTAKTVAALKPGKIRTDYFDTNLPGFCLRITPAGLKTFGVMYRHGGLKRRLTIGTYPPLTLADARGKAKDALRDSEKGIDPAAVKKAERTAETFGELCMAFMERYSKKQKSSWPEDQRIIDTYLLPEFKNTKASHVSRAEIRVLLERIAEGAGIQANRVLACIRKIYNWGISNDIVTANPCAQIPRPAQEHQRDRVLSEDEIKLAWKAFDTLGLLMSAMFKLRLLTAQRGGELAGMEWSEVDLEGAWWTIPAEKAKNGLAHRVPLSPSAVRILESLRAHQSKLKNETKKRSKFVFYAPRGDGHIEELQKAVQRIRKAMLEFMGAEEGTDINFTAHDLRRTAASTMTSMGIPRLVVGRILNHAEPGITAVYDRHSYDLEKREALVAWAKRLAAVVSSLKAVGTAETN